MQRQHFNIALVAAMTALTAVGCQSGESNGREELVSASVSKSPEVSFTPKTIDLHDTTYKYAVYVPPHYSSRRAWPAIMFLNGAGERGDDGVKQTQAGIGPAILKHPERFNCIVVLPQLPDLHVWTEDEMMELAMACLAKTETEYRINPERIALTGLSLGGFGTWKIGAVHGDRFCALGPICGGGETEWARDLAKTPVWCYHGADDPVVAVDKSREMVAVILAAGGEVRYTEVPETGHNSWDAAYGNPEFVSWLLKKR